MDALALLADLRAAKADPWIDGGRLRVKAPAGVLTPELQTAIAAERDALLALLVEEADAWAMSRLDDVLGDDGSDPEPPRLGALPVPRQALPYGVCTDCGRPCPADGMHWCMSCRAKGGRVPCSA